MKRPLACRCGLAAAGFPSGCQNRSHSSTSSLLVLAACLFATQMARSQVTPSSPSSGAAPSLEEVIVIAPRPPTAKELAGDSVQVFVNSHSKPKDTAAGALARWKYAICIKTEGLPAGFNDYVSARVEAIAAAVNTPQQTRNTCRTNVFVRFTNGPQKFIDNLIDKNPKILGFHYVSQAKKLKSIDRPIQGWHVTGVEAGASGIVVDSVWGGPHIVGAPLGSRLTTHVRSYIVFTLVVVDGKKILDYPIGSISDYIAMIVLSQVRLNDTCGELPSILDLMATGCTRVFARTQHGWPRTGLHHAEGDDRGQNAA
jgi:hypothetical protein